MTSSQLALGVGNLGGCLGRRAVEGTKLTSMICKKLINTAFSLVCKANCE